jgi:hypothetical protein
MISCFHKESQQASPELICSLKPEGTRIMADILRTIDDISKIILVTLSAKYGRLDNTTFAGSMIATP